MSWLFWEMWMMMIVPAKFFFSFYKKQKWRLIDESWRILHKNIERWSFKAFIKNEFCKNNKFSTCWWWRNWIIDKFARKPLFFNMANPKCFLKARKLFTRRTTRSKKPTCWCFNEMLDDNWASFSWAFFYLFYSMFMLQI